MRTARTRHLLCALAATTLVVGCGDESGGGPFDGAPAQPDTADGDEPAADNPLGGAVGGGGGGGTLIFDGEEIEIDGVTCILTDDTYDVGTVSDNGFRVFATQRRADSPVSAQILDADSIQWFPDGDDQIERSGNSVSSPPSIYFNNVDDRRIEASFDIECP